MGTAVQPAPLRRDRQKTACPDATPIVIGRLRRATGLAVAACPEPVGGVSARVCSNQHKSRAVNMASSHWASDQTRRMNSAGRTERYNSRSG